jgi:hypothetical protein
MLHDMTPNVMSLDVNVTWHDPKHDVVRCQCYTTWPEAWWSRLGSCHVTLTSNDIPFGVMSCNIDILTISRLGSCHVTLTSNDITVNVTWHDPKRDVVRCQCYMTWPQTWCRLMLMLHDMTPNVMSLDVNITWHDPKRDVVRCQCYMTWPQTWCRPTTSRLGSCHVTLTSNDITFGVMSCNINI